MSEFRPVEASARELEIMASVRPFTLLSPERLWSVLNAVSYISRYPIPGAVVECGVWRGGAMMTAALQLKEYGDFRDLYLFDTFEGMTEPTNVDRLSGAAAPIDWKTEQRDHTWIRAALEEVQSNLSSTGYPEDNIHYVKGDVAQTLDNHKNIPTQIALLRLDTDWYESTKKELQILYPLICSGGVLIVDDYGHWEGARKAVDEYFDNSRTMPFFHYSDYTGRVAIKV
jgi:O-methyltransferase